MVSPLLAFWPIYPTTIIKLGSENEFDIGQVSSGEFVFIGFISDF